MAKDNDNYDIQENLEDYIADYPDKEVRIINAAINAFSEKGFDATRTREIAKRAGIAEGTIFRYFPTKDSILERMVPLLIRVMQPKLEKPIQAIINENRDAPVGVIFSAILFDRLKMIQDNGRFIKSVLPELIHRAPLLNQLKENVIPLIELYIGQVLAHGKERGEVKDGVNPHIVAYQMLGFVLAYSMIGDSKDEREMIKDVNEFLKYAMEGWCN